MNNSDLLLTAPIMLPNTLQNASFKGIAAKGELNASDVKKTEKIARDFESVLLTKILDEMKNTIGNGLGDEEAGSEQIKGLFWLYLAGDMAQKGGLGLWKDLKSFFNDMQNTDTSAQKLDENL